MPQMNLSHKIIYDTNEFTPQNNLRPKIIYVTKWIYDKIIYDQ